MTLFWTPQRNCKAILLFDEIVMVDYTAKVKMELNNGTVNFGIFIYLA